MQYQDYYEVLGVAKDASQDEIKKQYRKLARKYHPDVSDDPNAEDKFKNMKEAYEVLKDPEKRKAFDQMGKGFHNGDPFSPPPDWEYETADASHHAQYNHADFSDFFNSIFGQQNTHQQHRQPFHHRGNDQHAKISVTLEEAFHGCEKHITLERQVIDPKTQQLQRKEQTLKIKIPAGVIQDQQIRLKGQGSAGLNGGEPGDLYLEIHLLPHKYYTTDKKDIYLTVPITPWEAALGKKIEIPTLGGTINLSVPTHAKSGQKVRLKGRGLPGTHPGNQYVTLLIQTPPADTDAARELYNKMAKTMPYHPRKDML